MRNFKNFAEELQPGAVPEPGRESIGGRFQSTPPKKPYKSAPQVTSEDTKEPTGKLKDACWTGYTAVGMKMKNGRKVPNCVPIKEAPEAGDDPINQGTPEGLVRRGNKTVLKKFKELSMEGAVPSTEKVVTVKHKTSGKELRVAQHALASYKVGGYHPVSQVKEAKDEEEYGYEGDMAMNQLKTIIRHSEYLMDMMKPDTDLPEWVQSKITLATDYIQTAADYMYSELKEEAEQIDEAPVVIKTNKEIGAKVTSIGPGGKETVIKTDPAYSKAEQEKKKIEEGKFNQMDVDRQDREAAMEKDGWKKIPANVTDKSGAKHSPMSRARDLARLALNKKAKSLKPVKEEKEESRKAGIVKNVVKSAKKKKSDSTKAEKFESEPVLSSEIQKQ